jgi:hypothetical protein
MENTPALSKRTYEQINLNRRRLLKIAYEAYPEYVYCDSDEFGWLTPEARVNVFDLYYLGDAGLLDLTRSTMEGQRRPYFFMLTTVGADLMEIPGALDSKFPVSGSTETDS